jgi:indole-3-acetate monooxygenase
MAPIALALARTAIDTVTGIAKAKFPVGRTGVLRDQPVLQRDIAMAEGVVRAARVWFYQVVDEVTAQTAVAAPLSRELRRDLLLSGVNAVQASATAVNLMHTAAGGTSVYATSPLERVFRDMHTLTQHRRVAPLQYEVAGRMFLGLDPGDASVLQ